MYPLRNIYMTSSGLGNFNTMTVTGNRNVIKKIPVSAAHGDIIFDQVVTGMDYLDCSRQSLSRLEFQLNGTINYELLLVSTGKAKTKAYYIKSLVAN